MSQARNFAPPAKVRIGVLDVTTNAPALDRRCEYNEIVNKSELESLFTSINSCLRIYFLHQEDSWSPLNISEDMLQTLMQQHNINLAFLDVASCFKHRTNNADQGYSAPIRQVCTGARHEIAYGWKFPEKRISSDGNDPWSIRQLGIYYQLDALSNQSIVIVLCPRLKSPVVDAVKQSLQDWASRTADLRDPRTLHQIVFEHTFRGWLEYMQFYESKISHHFDDLVVVSDDLLPDHVDFEQIANLRSIEDSCMPLRPIYNHLARVLKCLSGLKMSQEPSDNRSSVSDSQFQYIVQNYEHQLSGFMENATLLLTRIASVSQLLSDTLTFKQQHIAAKQHQLATKQQDLAITQNQLVLKLTQLSVNDSAAVRVITILTLIYLPATTIATILDMPFFSNDPAWKVSPRIWIFFAITVPLTLLTLMSAAYWAWMASDIRRAREETVCDPELGHSLQHSPSAMALQEMAKNRTGMRAMRTGTESA
ncbi:hypothetical protein KCU71_g1143, partial [Aureobasidium melanogenum]